MPLTLADLQPTVVAALSQHWMEQLLLLLLLRRLHHLIMKSRGRVPRPASPAPLAG